ncbi:MAG: MspA family porin, partial [Candidatus Nanopelagicales bacterium]
MVKTSTMRAAAIAAVTLVALAGPASADPADPAGPDVQPVAASAPPVDDGKVASNPPMTDKSPDGWIMTVGGKDEVQRAVAPLTTAVSTREYQVSGTFTGSLKGPGGGPAKGVLEVGYQIGCGIEMTTGNGVLLSGQAGGSAGIGVGLPFGYPDSSKVSDLFIPSIGANIGGGIAISLKPG